MPADVKVFRCLSDNAGVLIHDPITGACAAIDAPEEGPILAALEETGWRLTDILVTHSHADHVAGIAALKSRFGCRVVAPRRSGDAVPGADLHVGEGDTVSVGSLGAVVWETPGHCEDHVVYYFDAENAAFVGDVLFVMGCGRAQPGQAEVLARSVARVGALPDETYFVGGHDYTLSNARFALAADPGNGALQARAREAEAAKAEGRFLASGMMGDEKATNPFLRGADPAVARGVKLEGADPQQVFVALREWKNRF